MTPPVIHVDHIGAVTLLTRGDLHAIACTCGRPDCDGTLIEISCQCGEPVRVLYAKPRGLLVVVCEACRSGSAIQVATEGMAQ